MSNGVVDEPKLNVSTVLIFARRDVDSFGVVSGGVDGIGAVGDDGGRSGFWSLGSRSGVGGRRGARVTVRISGFVTIVRRSRNGLGAAEPVGEEEVEVAVAVGGARVALAVASSKGGGVRLIWGVAIESSGGAVFDEDVGAATRGRRIVSDKDAGFILGVEVIAVVEGIAEEFSGAEDLVLETIVF